LPIQTTARFNAEWISEFYVIMYSLASYVDNKKSMKDNILSGKETVSGGFLFSKNV